MSTQIIRCDFPDSFFLGGGKRFIWFIILSKTGIKSDSRNKREQKIQSEFEFHFYSFNRLSM
ncbi:TPA: hypothetical protein ACM6Z1_005849, partial [Raoultella ornithinolytica]